MTTQVGDNTTTSPFQRARTTKRRLKLFLWGVSGAGKTTLALQFPKPTVIDMESGTSLYADDYDFAVKRTTDASEVMWAIQWLAQNEHDFETLIIDPVSVYWEALQKKWSEIFLNRNKKSKGFKFEYYDLGMKEWGTIKSEWRTLVRNLIDLDMHVICTARSKTHYGDNMRELGVTFDGEKSLPYLFDVVVRQFRDESGRYMGECQKDRSGRLPAEPFEINYESFERCMVARETPPETAKAPIQETVSNTPAHTASTTQER